MMKSISVIIPNYNGRHLFEKYFRQNFEYLKSLQTDVEIIVVDDASKDDSVQYLEEHYGEDILLVRKMKNTGFSDSCNRGISLASKDLVFLLNTDVVLRDGYFEKLYKYFEYNDTFGVMGRIIGMDDEMIREAARSPKFLGRKIKSNDFFRFSDKEALTPTFYLSGAIALIDTHKLKSIGGFNEMFSPYYGEDQELSIRAWRLGWKCYYEHEAVCRHEVSASTKNHQVKKKVKKILFRNRYYMHYLHLYGIDLYLWHLQVLICDVLAGMLSGQFYKVQAYGEFLKNIKGLRAKKRAFKLQMLRHRSEISTFQVIENIRLMLKQHELIKLS